jgi:hypothetical protein
MGIRALRWPVGNDFFCITGDRIVEIPGIFYPYEVQKLDHLVFPDLRVLSDYAATTCKHECAIFKQSRHVRHAHVV